MSKGSRHIHLTFDIAHLPSDILHPMRLSAMASRLAEFCCPSSCEDCGWSTNASAMLWTDCANQRNTLGSTSAGDRCGMPLFELDGPCPHCLGKGVPHYERIVRVSVFD